MAEDDTQQKVLHLLDVVSAGVGRLESLVDETRAGVGRMEVLGHETRAGVAHLEERVGDLTTETRAGLQRIERRLGNVETRIEGIEDDSRNTKQRVSELETRIK